MSLPVQYLWVHSGYTPKMALDLQNLAAHLCAHQAELLPTLMMVIIVLRAVIGHVNVVGGGVAFTVNLMLEAAY